MLSSLNFRFGLLACLALPVSGFAQQLAHHDVLLFPLAKNADGQVRVAAPQFLTAFNPMGYNNQPQFFGHDQLWLTTQFPTDTTQTEITSLDLRARTRTRVTATPEAEYSPMPMPGGQRFSCVRVEAGGGQRLWSFALDRSDAGRVVFPKITGVGYHCWLSDTLAALFIVGENGQPHMLVLAGTAGQKPVRIASNIGRSLHRLADGRLVFVQKATPETWFIKAFDPKKQTSEILATTLPGVEDFAVLPNGHFLAGSGSKLYQRSPGDASNWVEVADLVRWGVGGISRLAVQGWERLAVVVQGKVSPIH